MTKLQITFSLRDAAKAQDAINDCNQLRKELDFTSSDQCESRDFDTDCEEEYDEMEQLKIAIEEQMELWGVEEYEIEEISRLW